MPEGQKFNEISSLKISINIGETDRVLVSDQYQNITHLYLRLKLTFSHKAMRT